MAVAAQSGVSRRHAQRLIRDGVVTVNGQTAAAGDKGRPVAAADRIELLTAVGHVVPQPELTLDVLAEGPGWVAIDKPAGQPVHPLRESETGTTLNALAARYPQVQGVGASSGEGGLRSGVVHRLDVATSGVLLFALDDPTFARFRQAFAEHRTTKRYVALVHGHPADRGEAELPLAVTQHRPARASVRPEDDLKSRRCRLAWRVEARGERTSRLSVDLETGFLHQIRVSLAHLGYPVVGDRVYGPTDTSDEQRLMLHAAELRCEQAYAASPEPTAFRST
jgi:23S rRNA pseudouridine1911/1915/1917 synthase